MLISINIQGNTITIKASNNRATTYWLHCIIICYYNHTTQNMHSIKQQIVYHLWKRWALYTTSLYYLTSDKQFLIIIATRIDSYHAELSSTASFTCLTFHRFAISTTLPTFKLVIMTTMSLNIWTVRSVSCTARTQICQIWNAVVL